MRDVRDSKEQFREATERMVRKLGESEECFRRIFEEGPLGMALVGQDYRFLQVNNRLCEMVGYTETELTQLGFPDITYPEDLAKDVEQAEQLFRGEIPFYHIEKRYVTKGQDIIWIHLTASVVRDEQGEPLYGLAMIKDITDRKWSEEVLRRSENKYRTLINEFPCPIFVSRMDDFVFTEVNDRACANYGYSREEFLKMNILDLEIDGPLHEQVRNVYDEMEIGQVVEVHGTNRRKDGSTFPVHVRFNKLDDELALAVVRDVTELRRAEEALRKYESMVSASRDLMVFVDSTYTYQAVNPAYCEALGKTHEEVLGHTVASVLGEKFFETTAKPNMDRCLAGERMNFEFWWDLPVLGHRHADARYDPFYDADGSVSGVLVHIRDTTDRKQAEDALREARRMEAILQIALTMKHHVNNELTTILTNSQSLVSEGSLTEEQRELAQEISDAAWRITKDLKKIRNLKTAPLVASVGGPKMVDLGAATTH